MNDDRENNLRISLINKLWDEIKLFLRDSGFVQQNIQAERITPVFKTPVWRARLDDTGQAGQALSIPKSAPAQHSHGPALICGTLRLSKKSLLFISLFHKN
jgi:hypothetical protein